MLARPLFFMIWNHLCLCLLTFALFCLKGICATEPKLIPLQFPEFVLRSPFICYPPQCFLFSGQQNLYFTLYSTDVNFKDMDFTIHYYPSQSKFTSVNYKFTSVEYEFTSVYFASQSKSKSKCKSWTLHFAIRYSLGAYFQ